MGQLSLLRDELVAGNLIGGASVDSLMNLATSNVSPYQKAVIYAGLDQKDEALKSLEEGLSRTVAFTTLTPL